MPCPRRETTSLVAHRGLRHAGARLRAPGDRGSGGPAGRALRPRWSSGWRTRSSPARSSWMPRTGRSAFSPSATSPAASPSGCRPDTPVEAVMTSPVLTIAGANTSTTPSPGCAGMRFATCRSSTATGRLAGILDLHDALAAASERLMRQIDRLTPRRHAGRHEGGQGGAGRAGRGAVRRPPAGAGDPAAAHPHQQRPLPADRRSRR